ncbi:hypothetical protein J7K19_02130, partial [bacterium]|nr:hypothetical protein [bacterium]
MEKEISGSLEHKKRKNKNLWEKCKNCPYWDGEENGCVLYGQSEDCLYTVLDQTDPPSRMRGPEIVELTPEENKELRAELEKIFTVDFWYIDSDSFRCTIEEAQYSDLKKLEELGWS